jgi:type IV pilus assembly protein PilN
LIEVNLFPGGKKRAPKGSRFSLKLPSAKALPKDVWVIGMVAVSVGVVVAAAYLALSVNSRRGDLQVALEEAISDSARYADLIEQNNAIIARRDSIAQRVAIIQEIDGDRYVWSHIMDEVARNLPDYTWLESLMQVSLEGGLQIRIQGRAGNNFAMTQFMENLESSLFIRNVELISTEQVVEPSGGAGRVVSDFVLEAYYDPPPPELLQTVPLLEEAPSELPADQVR